MYSCYQFPLVFIHNLQFFLQQQKQIVQLQQRTCLQTRENVKLIEVL